LHHILGDYDYFAITESPSDEAAVSVSLSVCAREHVKTSTLRAFPMPEFAKLVEKLP
jgi:uncharacterized protein with GYD domain